MDLTVKYNRGPKLMGTTSRAHGDNNPACVTKFDGEEEAADFYEQFNNHTISNFGNAIWLNKNRVLVDDGFEPFDSTQKLDFHIWAYNRKMTNIISMSDSFVKVFEGITTGLCSIYARDRYHGRLLEGITISKNLDVKLYNISNQPDSMEKGVLKDLKDLKKLVKELISRNPVGRGFERPACVDLYLAFKNRMFNAIQLDPSITVQKWKFYAYFNFINPIFADAKGRIGMIKKFNNLWALFPNEVNRTLTFSDPPTTMPEWWLRICPGTYLHERIMPDMYMYACKKSFHEPPKSIIAFHKACLRHKDKKNSGEFMEEVGIEVDLLETLPDYLPKVFYEFVHKMAWTRFLNQNLFDSYISFFQKSDPKDPKFGVLVF